MIGRFDRQLPVSMIVIRPIGEATLRAVLAADALGILPALGDHVRAILLVILAIRYRSDGAAGVCGLLVVTGTVIVRAWIHGAIRALASLAGIAGALALFRGRFFIRHNSSKTVIVGSQRG